MKKNITEVTQGKITPDEAAALPNACSYPGGDQYFHMRSMILAASLPDEPRIPAFGAYRDQPVSAGYTQQDADMINRAAELCGFPGKKLSSAKSEEGVEIHRHSPTNHNSGKYF